MSVSSAKGMLSRIKKLERSHGATDEMREWVSDSFGAAIAGGSICPADGPVVMRCLLNWISNGTTRGTAGEGLLR